MGKHLTKKRFLNSVLKEVKALKQHATQEEIANLRMDEFNPFDTHSCIYGQLTGSCDSFRAKELMELSCVKVISNCELEIDEDYRANFRDIADTHYFEKNVNQTWDLISDNGDNKFYRDFEFLSALELYIALRGANIKGIMKFLRGEKEEVNLDKHDI